MHRRYVFVVVSTMIGVLAVAASALIWIFVDQFAPDRSVYGLISILAVAVMPLGLAYALVALDIDALGAVNRATVVSASSFGILVLLGIATKIAEALGKTEAHPAESQFPLLLVSLAGGVFLHQWSDAAAKLPERVLFPSWALARRKLLDVPKQLSACKSAPAAAKAIGDAVQRFVEEPVSVYILRDDGTYHGDFGGTAGAPPVAPDDAAVIAVSGDEACITAPAGSALAGKTVFRVSFSETPLALVAIANEADAAREGLGDEYQETLVKIFPDIGFALAFLAARLRVAAVVDGVLKQADTAWAPRDPASAKRFADWLVDQRYIALSRDPSFGESSSA
jgi:hypothetical protein